MSRCNRHCLQQATASVYSAARVAHMLPRGCRSPDRLPQLSPASTRPLCTRAHGTQWLTDVGHTARPTPEGTARRCLVRCALATPRRHTRTTAHIYYNLLGWFSKFQRRSIAHGVAITWPNSTDLGAPDDVTSQNFHPNSPLGKRAHCLLKDKLSRIIYREAFVRVMVLYWMKSLLVYTKLGLFFIHFKPNETQFKKT